MYNLLRKLYKTHKFWKKWQKSQFSRLIFGQNRHFLNMCVQNPNSTRIKSPKNRVFLKIFQKYLRKCVLLVDFWKKCFRSPFFPRAPPPRAQKGGGTKLKLIRYCLDTVEPPKKGGFLWENRPKMAIISRNNPQYIEDYMALLEAQNRPKMAKKPY